MDKSKQHYGKQRNSKLPEAKIGKNQFRGIKMPLDFKNPCSGSHLRTLRRNYDEYLNKGDKGTAALFQEQIEETERKCGVVTRSMSSTSQLKRNTQQGMPSGFGSQLDMLFSSSPKEEKKSQHIPSTAFGRMLEASELGGSQNTIQSAITKERRTSTDQEAVEMAFVEDGIKRMVERVLRRVSQELNRPNRQLAQSVQAMPVGFRASLDAISPERHERMLDTNPPESKIFDWMRTNRGSQPTKSLDELAEGESIVTMINFKPIRIARRNGRLITSSVDEKPTEENARILPSLQEGESRIVQRGFFRKMLITRKGNKIINSYL